ncbi:MAG: amino acid--tRNA ligase-related protein [Acidobacteriota bacterium]
MNALPLLYIMMDHLHPGEDPYAFGRSFARQLRTLHQTGEELRQGEEHRLTLGPTGLPALLLSLPEELIEGGDRWSLLQLSTAWLSRLRVQPAVYRYGKSDLPGLFADAREGKPLSPAGEGVKEGDLGPLAAELLWIDHPKKRRSAFDLLTGLLTGYGASSNVLPLYAARHGLRMAAQKGCSPDRRKALTDWAVRLLAASPRRRDVHEFLPELNPQWATSRPSSALPPDVHSEPVAATFTPHLLPSEEAAEKLLEDPTSTSTVVAGRVVHLRRHRTVAFIDLAAGGRRFQIGLPANLPGEARTERIRIHDYLVTEGSLERSRAGTPTVFVTKMLCHIPCQLSPQEAPVFFDRYRLNHGVAGVLSTLRTGFRQAGFIELSTPVLERGFFGGRARPFRTWVAADERWGYLRLTFEKGLKAAIASGIPRCFEIGPSFRNEGRDAAHSPEFTLLEAYAALASMDDMAALAVRLIRNLLPDLPEAVEVSARDACYQTLGVDLEDREAVADALEAAGLESDEVERGRMTLTKRAVRQLDGMVVLTDIPLHRSPLSAQPGEEASLFWLVVNGETCGEIVREELSASRVREDLANHARSHPMVERNDESFVRILEAGLPPCVGLALGVTRLCAAVLGVDNVNDLSL